MAELNEKELEALLLQMKQETDSGRPISIIPTHRWLTQQEIDYIVANQYG